MQATYYDVVFWALVVVSLCAKLAVVGFVASIIVFAMAVYNILSLFKGPGRFK